jgi:hypothetical protein
MILSEIPPVAPMFSCSPTHGTNYTPCSLTLRRSTALKATHPPKPWRKQGEQFAVVLYNRERRSFIMQPLTRIARAVVVPVVVRGFEDTKA